MQGAHIYIYTMICKQCVRSIVCTKHLHFFNLAETVMGRLPVTRAQLLDPKGTRRNDAKNKGLIQLLKIATEILDSPMKNCDFP